jgi:hypothetical protein
MAGWSGEKPAAHLGATETFGNVEMCKKLGPLFCSTMQTLVKLIEAGVAMLLMCCQCGEVDQTLSLIRLQLIGSAAAPSHTSACLNGLTELRGI